VNFGKEDYDNNYIYNYSTENFDNKFIRNFTAINFALNEIKKEVIYKKYKKLFLSNNLLYKYIYKDNYKYLGILKARKN
jgi:hypothetical protein